MVICDSCRKDMGHAEIAEIIIMILYDQRRYNLMDELDNDGYPTTETSTTETLMYIENYPIKNKNDCNELLLEIAHLFEDYGNCTKIDGTWRIATGGWTGNESIISALQENTVFWVFSWYLSKRGGYYEFKCDE